VRWTAHRRLRHSSNTWGCPQIVPRAPNTAYRIPSAAAFGQALIQMFEVDSKRLAAGLHNSIPSTIWLALYYLAALALAITGYRAGLGGRRSIAVTVVLALAFAAVLHLIADLDRPDEGFLTVSQQTLTDLQTSLHRK
jgi:hypothetical protein